MSAGTYPVLLCAVVPVQFVRVFALMRFYLNIHPCLGRDSSTPTTPIYRFGRPLSGQNCVFDKLVFLELTVLWSLLLQYAV